MKNQGKERLFQYLAIVGSAFAACRPIFDTDLWWHLTVGRWILSHGQIPNVDYWNLFGAGKPWRAYSWLPEIVIAHAYSLGSEHGLVLLKLLVALLLSASVISSFATLAKDRFVGTCLGLMVIAALSENLALRPQTLSWMFLVLLIPNLEQLCNKELVRTSSIKIFLLMAVWANTHITTVFGIAVTFVWCLEREPRRNLIRALRISAIALAGTFCTPYFGGEWLTAENKALHPILHQSIAEFQPTTIFNYQGGILGILFVLLIATTSSQTIVKNIPRLILVSGFFVLALTAIKWIPYAAILTASLVATIWGSNQGVDFGKIGEHITQLRYGLARIPSVLLVFVTLVLVGRSAQRLVSTPIQRDAFPTAAVDFILQHKLPHPVLNIFGDGGYLIFRFSDEQGNPIHTVPIDGRTNVNDPKVMLAHEAAFSGIGDWKQYFTIVNPGTVLWRSGLPLESFLALHSVWCSVYRDHPESHSLDTQGWVVFVQKDQDYEGICEKR